TSPRMPPAVTRQRPRPAAAEEVHRISLEELGPPSLLVDADREILHMSDSVGRFLQPQGGVPSRDVMRMARPELQGELRAALAKAINAGERSLSPFVPLKLEGSDTSVAILVSPKTSDGERVAL